MKISKQKYSDLDLQVVEYFRIVQEIEKLCEAINSLNYKVDYLINNQNLEIADEEEIPFEYDLRKEVLK